MLAVRSAVVRLSSLLAVAVLTSSATSASVVSAAPPRAEAVASVRIAAVGDIACKNPPGNNRKVCRYDDVARGIAQGGYDKLLLLGDNQYEYGLYRDYVENYDAYFGDLLPITAPSPGNHEYGKDPGAAGYFRYFGSLAPAPFYSFDLGAWHVVSLDSTICRAGGVECLPGSPQHEWLEADLEASDAACTLAYWHHPRWDHLHYQKADWTDDYELRRTQPLWDLLYEHDADVVLAGHNHNYSRWFPADTEGEPDPDRGITQYVVGTGGRNLNGFGNFHTRPEIFVRGQGKAFGHLEMTLRPGGWSFRWVSAPGQPSYVDQGTGACH
jgi:hypothetical protein